MVIPYARSAAVGYARRWALGRNPRWYDFENLGGDCTNFASQCLFAGSGVMNFTPERGWYYLSLEYRSPSWTGVEFLYRFLMENPSAGPFGQRTERELLLPGDLIQLGRGDGQFYHTLIVMAVRPTILVAAHSYDALDRPLDTYTYEQARYIHIDGVRIW